MHKVLIVDDNDNNRFALNLLLEKVSNIQIFEAIDGKFAVEMCLRENFDLVFMDIMMPNMDGFEATKLIKKIQKNIMVIALSALEDDASKNKILSLGAEDYLSKPLNSKLFMVRIEHYLRIIELRHKKHTIATNVLNPFDAKVYSRSITFRVDKEVALAEFWDYWLNGEKDILNLSDCVRMIYGFGLWLLKNGESFNIIVEESSDNLYIMLMHGDTLKNTIIKNILLKHFSTAKYILNNGVLSFQLDKENKKVVSSVEISAEAKKILTKTHTNAINAIDYIEHSAISFMSKIEGLENINDKIDLAILKFEATPTKSNMCMIGNNFQEYADILNQLMDFGHLGFALHSLINFLYEIEEDKLVEEKTTKLSTMLLHLLEDLNAWRENVFITQVARDIHYLDASLLSSCMQIESIFEEQSLTTSEDDIEFF